MITAKLQGGLGNQMFQIAAAHSLSMSVGTKTAFSFEKCNTPNQGYPSQKYYDNIFSNINNINLNYENFIQYDEPKFSFQKLPLLDNLCLNGYFQSEKYFCDHKEEISNLFVFDDKIFNILSDYIDKTIKNKFTVIHVRRGDYLSKPNYHNVSDLHYYQQAMKNIKNTDFIVISDDIEWCKNNFNENNIFFSEFNSEIYDFHLLLISQNIILSNSTFSWWGAWLNKNKNKKIISPKNWFGPHGPKDTQDLIPENWIKI
jgi:hypothetical protein